MFVAQYFKSNKSLLQCFALAFVLSGCGGSGANTQNNASDSGSANLNAAAALSGENSSTSGSVGTELNVTGTVDTPDNPDTDIPGTGPIDAEDVGTDTPDSSEVVGSSTDGSNVVPTAPVPQIFDGSTNYGPMNDFAIAADLQYQGVLGDAQLTLQSAAAFSHSLIQHPFAGRDLSKNNGIYWKEVMDMPFVDIGSTHLNPPSDGVHECDSGQGTYTTKQFVKSVDNTDYQVISYDYDLCKHDTSRVYVSGYYELGTDMSSDAAAEHFAAYKDIRIIAYGSGTVYVHGAVRHPGDAACGLAYGNTSFLHILNETGEQLLLDNLTSTNIGAKESWCAARFSTRNWLQGKAYLAQYGAVSVETPSHLSHSATSKFYFARIEQPALDSSNGAKFGGLLTLAGASDSNAEFTYKSINMRPPNGGYYGTFAIPTVSITVDTGDGMQEEVEYDSTVFGKGAMIDLNDSDNDGMRDGWELLYNLNPNNPSDANLDLDGDGFTNVEEFVQLGEPRSWWSTGRHVDQQVGLSATTRVDSDTGQTFLDIKLSGSLSNMIYQHPASTVRLEFEGDAEWIDGCYATGIPEVVTCGLGRPQRNSPQATGTRNAYDTFINPTTNIPEFRFWDKPITLLVHNTSNVVVTASTNMPTGNIGITPDPDMSNNTAVLEYRLSP